jgi:prepilin-type N-terminal cleavage/methylation domain-containing protein
MNSQTRGFTILELITVLALSSTILGISILNLKDFNRPTQNATSQLRSYLKEVRIRALSSTAAYRISAVSSDRITAAFADRCSSGTFTADPRADFTMPAGAVMVTTGWTVCINSRGIADTNQIVTIQGNDGQIEAVEIMLGGATRIL